MLQRPQIVGLEHHQGSMSCRLPVSAARARVSFTTPGSLSGSWSATLDEGLTPSNAEHTERIAQVTRDGCAQRRVLRNLFGVKLSGADDVFSHEGQEHSQKQAPD